MNVIKDSSLALLIIDVQEVLLPSIYEHQKLLGTIEMMASSCRHLNIPIYITEQYPKGLGHTAKPLVDLGKVFEKTTFSGYESIAKMHETQWAIVGIEAHICVLQTVKDLLINGKEPIVLYDGIGSRHLENTKMAIEEMRDMKVRITSSESLLYELLKDSRHPQFKSILELVKTRCGI